MVIGTFQLKTRAALLAGSCLLGGMAATAQVAGAPRAVAVTQAWPATPDGAPPLPQGTPRSWAELAVNCEVGIIDGTDRPPLRYLQRKVDAKGDVTREIIESKDGNVARLVERDGEPITAAEDAAERDRLNGDIALPGQFMKHRRRDGELRADVVQLMRLLPQAMSNIFTPGQPQLKDVEGRQVVLDFHPDPAFHPPTMFADVLTGFDGRVWIDAQSHCVRRIQGHVLKPVNIGFGFVVKLFPGGTLKLEQKPTVDGRWVYSQMEEHLTARVLLVKTIPENAAITSWDFRPMASLLPYQDAIRLLLATPVPLH